MMRTFVFLCCLLHANAKSYFSCPAIAGTQEKFTLENYQTINLQVSGRGLCTLSVQNEGSPYVPVARSYGRSRWERSGGAHAAKLPKWDCEADSCESALPPGDYVLERRRLSRESSKELWARLLERATFGATRSLLRRYEGVNMTKFLKDEMRRDPTSHREYYRLRLNTFQQQDFPQFPVSTPCSKEETSVWSRAIFFEDDIGKRIVVRTVQGHKEIAVGDETRSVLNAFRYIRFGVTRNLPDASYRLCGGVESIRRGLIKLKRLNTKRPCFSIIDTMIDFEGDRAPQALVNTMAAPLRQKRSWKPLPNYHKTVTSFELLNSFPSSVCESLNVTGKNRIPSIFTRTEDNAWLIFRPTARVQENSIHNPLKTGGYEDMDLGRVETCGNVARNFWNEHSCSMAQGMACLPGSKGKSYYGPMVCGSPGEVANQVSFGDSWLRIRSMTKFLSRHYGYPEDVPGKAFFERQRELIWNEISLSAKDQLRQRMAWALFQIFSLPKTAIAGEDQHTESFLNYYDIFVRNAFGNYRDILREITYNPMMAESLSYLRSESIGKSFPRTGVLAYPDENFARELMQLFSIGLVKLNRDGTPVLDDTNSTIPTYHSEDIANFARAWTGFFYQPRRANVENPSRRTKNLIDPLRIRPAARDRFPKTDLGKGYIGDTFPLCSDLPPRSYLRAGAKYRLLGRVPVPELVHDSRSWALSNSVKRLRIDAESGLYKSLCAPGPNGDCSFPSVVILSKHVGCSQCNMTTPRVVQVGDVFYEYLSVPCVRFPFFEGGRAVRSGINRRTQVCVDPSSEEASEACCDEEDSAEPVCQFSGERMKYHDANKRCQASGKKLCKFRKFSPTSECPHVGHHWTPNECQVLVKINSDGQIAIVHETERPEQVVAESTPSYFNVRWSGTYPTVLNKPSECHEARDESLLCPVTVTDTVVFTSLPKSVTQIRYRLQVGFPDRSMFGKRAFKATRKEGFTVYSKDGGDCCDMSTIFKVVTNGKERFYRNVLSKVTIKESLFSFRNPPIFNSLVPSEFSVATAQHETEAVLEYFLFHRNTAPFVAHRLIQRFGVSNPSPRYVNAVAGVFRRGRATIGGTRFGRGKYGDLSATIAMVLLYREGRTSQLKGDPAWGSLREPILKVLGLMRSMEFQSSVPLLDLDLLDRKIGQASYEQRTVFNFFRPEYRPPGLASSSLLAAPESEVMSSGHVLGLVNGLFSLLDSGLVRCNEGFASFGCSRGSSESAQLRSGALSLKTNDGMTNDEVLNELSLLLTAGRVPKEKLQLIQDAISGLSNREEFLKAAAQYIVTTPEFHSTSAPEASLRASAPKESTEDVDRPSDGYKAVIHIAFRGGCDSYNMLVPAPSCAIYDNYKAVRNTIALNESSILEIDGSEGQPCASFGVHKELPLLRRLYSDKELLFFANTGVLTEPVNKDNYKKKTKTNLFAHDAMQDEIDKLDPFQSAPGTGTLGRLADKLEEKGYKVSRTAVESAPANLSGRNSIVSPIYTLDEDGIRPLDVNLTNPVALGLIDELNGGGPNGKPSGVYGEIWSTKLLQSINQSDSLHYILQSSTETETEFADTKLGKRVKLISQLIKTRKQRDVDRDFFFVSLGGFDHHVDVNERLSLSFQEVNEAIGHLVEELKLMDGDVWKDVVIVQSSDFGRTLTPNSSGGSDHGWGGNYWMTGGSVKGGQIKGRYPTSFDESGEENVGRGRLIPTTPFDSCFNGVADWVGLDRTQALDEVLPNRKNFDDLFAAGDLFN